MDERIDNFLKRHRLCVLTVTMPDGSLHSSVSHFAHRDEPWQMYMVTEETSRKCQPLQNGAVAKASMVVGFNEEEWVELQMSGEVQMHKEGFDHDTGRESFEDKFGGQMKTEKVILIFTPGWYRYSEFKRNHPLVLESAKK